MGGILILVLILAAGGGGALWYFKLCKPKSSVKGGDELDEFDFDEDDEAEEYGDYEDVYKRQLSDHVPGRHLLSRKQALFAEH